MIITKKVTTVGSGLGILLNQVIVDNLKLKRGDIVKIDIIKLENETEPIEEEPKKPINFSLKQPKETHIPRAYTHKPQFAFSEQNIDEEDDEEQEDEDAIEDVIPEETVPKKVIVDEDINEYDIVEDDDFVEEPTKYDNE